VAQIEGRNPVREALRSGRAISAIYIAERAPQRGALADIVAAARRAGVPLTRLSRAELDARARSRAHQGVIAEAADVEFGSWRDGVAIARANGEIPLLLALDGITDPQNFGSLLRSAEVFGAHGVIAPGRRSAPITPAVEKAAAGALGYVLLDRVGSLERALAECRKEGLWIVGLAGDGETTLEALDLLSEPIVLVVGSEGAGISRLVRDRADALVRIPMAGRIGSLNAAVAGAIALYETRRRRG
jgi:23S rRNA (guanosine2251-2'-O)-methyltransferase